MMAISASTSCLGSMAFSCLTHGKIILLVWRSRAACGKSLRLEPSLEITIIYAIKIKRLVGVMMRLACQKNLYYFLTEEERDMNSIADRILPQGRPRAP